MTYKVYTILLATEDDTKTENEFVRVSLKNSEIFVPILAFEGDKEKIKESVNQALDNFLNKL